MKIERKFIGIGREHIVYRSKNNPNQVIKKPTAFMDIFLRLQGKGADYARQRLFETEKELRGTRVKLPNTRIIGVDQGRSYRIGQQFIPKEIGKTPIEDIPNQLLRENLPHLVQRYLHNPDNFRTYQGTLYLLDFSISPNLSSIFVDQGHIPESFYYQIQDHLPRDLFYKMMRFLG